MFQRSQDILNGPEWANVRALYRSSGFTSGEMEKPIIAVVNAYNSVCPGHFLLRQISDRVKEGICAGGGMAVEFGVIGACDGIAMGHKGMRHILPGREILANEIETMMESHRLDGMVLVGSCDKIVPGMVMAAMRLNIPTIFINGGPTLPGRMKENNPYGGEYIDHSIIQQSEGALKAGIISQEQFDWLENNAVPTPGSCAMLGTANTMCCLTEAMGLALPNCAAIPAVYSHRLAMAYETGYKIMDLIAKDIKPRDIITKESILNAVKVNSAIGGSTNAVLHLLAIAYEGEIDFDITEFGEYAKDIPHLVPMIPAGHCTLLDFYEAGGVQTIMKELSSRLDVKQMTCTAKTIAENLECVQNKNTEVIRPLDNPVHHRGGIGILKGNLALDGSVTKPSAIPDDSLYFKGEAIIFENEEDALRGIRAHEVKAGDVVVIRNEGPKGGPGMPEMYKAMKLLVGMDLGSKVCVITDGRFSGSNNGCFVGHICPEAADDGNIAYLENGDLVTVDVTGGTIDAEVDFATRRQGGCRAKQPKEKGYLYQYNKNVKSASLGAIIPTRD